LALYHGRVLEQAETKSHVDAVDGLGEADADVTEAFVFSGIAFDVVLARE